jgi:hypothetical protein
MAYGIEIQNADGRIVIDTSYANFGFLSESTSTASAGATFPGLAGANVVIDLVAARANTGANGIVSRDDNKATWVDIGKAGVPTNVYYVIRRFTTLNPATATGYGFAVYNSTSNVIFTSNIAKNFEVVAVGIFNGSKAGPATNISFPSATTWYSDFTKYYAVVNGTSVSELSFTPPNNYHGRACYRWRWANSTHGRITVESGVAFGTALTPLNPVDYDFYYMILKELS